MKRIDVLIEPLLAEALPLVVAVIGAVLWIAYPHLYLPARYDTGIDRLLVGLLLPPPYFIAGVGWFVVGRPRTGLTVLALHSVAALVMVFYGFDLVFGAGDFAGPGPDAPFHEFFLWLAVSLLISAVSVVALATVQLRGDEAVTV